MGGFPGRRRALVDRAFATFGEDAHWSGRDDAVRIRFRGADEDDRFGAIQIARASTIVRVRGWELTPAEGDLVAVADGENAGRYRVLRGTMRDAKGVWHCPVEIVS